ncbi:MAG: IPT/TIG domain-containing protein, partial [Candidatus Poseidoniaceae archaeon]
MRISLFLVTLLLLMVPFGHAITSSGEHRIDALTDDSDINLQSIARSSTYTVSPASGWTTGGEEITITGTGFSDLAFSNTTDDGINHQWAETTMDYSDQAGRWNAVAVDSNGHIHVVQIKDESYQIRHSVNDGTGWISGKINDCGSTYCWDIHMVIDDNDHIHLAYTTYTSWDETLVYMNYDGTTWTDTVVSSSAHFGPIGIAVDSSNNPHISYAANGADQCGAGLRISSYDGSSWSYTNVDQGANRGCESAIVIDESDHMYIAYQDRSSSKLKIATDKSGSWDSYLVDTGTSPSNLYPGYMTSMAMDQQGQFHIAHFDEKEDDLRYSTGAPNSQWTTTIVESSGHTGRDPSIALDFSGTPHIAYNSWAGWDLKYAVYNSTTSSWDKSFISTTGDVGQGNSLFIDQNGVMHVAFSDEDNAVLKYATRSTGLIQTMEITVQFGQYGSVTGTVVNDTTIIVTTPTAGQTADTVDLTLWDMDDTSHPTGASFTFISPDDLDSDGVLNADDDCPNTAGDSTSGEVGCPDSDGDGFSDSTDSFPADASEWGDADGDGVGDNADAFPNDASETLDTDGDGVGDNADVFPNDASESVDSDADGVGDNADAFPQDANETLDSDGDGVGDNADAFPQDANETLDSDGDGIGDNSDPNPNQHSDDDSDGDSIANIDDAFPNDAT